MKFYANECKTREEMLTPVRVAKEGRRTGAVQISTANNYFLTRMNVKTF